MAERLELNRQEAEDEDDSVRGNSGDEEDEASDVDSDSDSGSDSDVSSGSDDEADFGFSDSGSGSDSDSTIDSGRFHRYVGTWHDNLSGVEPKELKDSKTKCVRDCILELQEDDHLLLPRAAVAQAVTTTESDRRLGSYYWSPRALAMIHHASEQAVLCAWRAGGSLHTEAVAVTRKNKRPAEDEDEDKQANYFQELYEVRYVAQEAHRCEVAEARAARAAARGF
jgi:hypothetical protein